MTKEMKVIGMDQRGIYSHSYVVIHVKLYYIELKSDLKYILIINNVTAYLIYYDIDIMQCY